LKVNTRAVIAYIAGRLITDKDAKSVYDYTEEVTSNFSGTVTSEEINILDEAEGCSITGKRDGSKFSLLHHGDGSTFDLEIKGVNYEGFDVADGNHFNGNVKKETVSLYTYSDGYYYTYQLA
jgi:hypothetical protein